MEDLLEDTSLSSLLAGISNSSKFKVLCKTIYTLRTKYLARGVKQEQITEKIMSKIFNTKNPITVNWFNLKNTLEYHKIRNLVELDPKTIELALAIQQEIHKMKKKKKHEKQAKDYTLDDMLDLFQFRLESNFNLDKNSSSSGSESPSDLGESFWSPEHPGMSFYDQTKHNFNFDGFNHAKDHPHIGKRKPKKNIDAEEVKGDITKKIKVNYTSTEPVESNRSTNISDILTSELFFEPFKRARENDNGIHVDKTKAFKM